MLKKFSLLLLLCFLLSACTFRKLAYRWADSYLLMQVNSAFDLTSTQEVDARLHIKQWLDWHRRTQLPLYINFVSQIGARTQNSLSLVDTNWLYSEFIRFGDLMAKEMAAPGAKFILTLTEQQFDHLAKNNEKRNKKRFEKYFLGEKKFILQREKDVRKYANEWLGSVNSQQGLNIHEYAQQAWTFERLRYENTLNNQADFLKTIRTRNLNRIQHRFHETFAFPQDYQTEAYRAAYQDNRTRIAQLILDLHRLSTSEQKNFFQKKLGELKDDLAEMQNTQFL